jgi:hypothetical protein
MDEGLPSKLCGRGLSAADLETIRRQVQEAVPPLRAEVARRVCRALSWSDAVGRPKLMSCRVALLRLHRAGLIELPAPCRGNGNGRGLLRQRVDWPAEAPVAGAVQNLAGLHLAPVADPMASALWNGLIDRYHYLGYRPLPGAQLRYLIGWERGVLGAIGFGAAAWKVAVRDRWIGWEAATREQHLQRVVNNARFLILPWVRVANLASKVLALAARQVPDEFGERYGVRPVLLETFVEAGRFAGTCYRAANWCYLGETTGRGKLDRYKRRALPVKDVYVYPLEKGFRQALGVGP